MKFCNDKSKNNKQHLDILSKNGSKTKIGQIYSINRILSRRFFGGIIIKKKITRQIMKRFPITGTFIDEITYDIPSSNWSHEEWAKDLDNMKAVGIDTMIFIRGGFEGRTIFPSEHFFCLRKDDFVEFILEEAEKRDMKVFLGLYISNLTWNDGDVKGEIAANKLFLGEATKKYASRRSFGGWYIPHEVAANSYNIERIVKNLAAMCKDKTPDKQVLLSPFFKTETSFHTPFTADRFFDEWDGVFESFGKDVDICAFQDGSAPLKSAVEYFKSAKKLCDAHGIKLWANVETFERDVRTLYFPIPFELLRTKLELLAPYVEKNVTFEFSHFLSPQSIFPSARNLNKLYVDYYGTKYYER